MQGWLTIAMLGLAGTAVAQQAPEQARPAWPYPDDIPRPAPVAVGLAGAAEADITRFLLAQGPRGAQLSPDGTKLLYVSSVTGKPQLWVVDTAGGHPRQLTFGLGVDGGTWTPDGTRIVYSADRGGNERYGFYTITPDGAREAELLAPSEAFTQIGDFADGGRSLIYATTRRDGRAFDTWRVPVAGGRPAEVFRGRMGLYPALANPQGTLIAMAESRGEDGNDLSLLDLRTGRERVLRKPADAAQIEPAAWTPDGRNLYLITNEGREFAALALYDTVAGRTTVVEAPPVDVVAADLSPDGRHLAWLTDEGGIHTLHLKDLGTGRLLPAPKFPAGTMRIAFARAAPVLSIGVNGSRTPGEAWVWDLRTGRARQAIGPTTAGVDLATLVEPIRIGFRARDTVPLSGLLYLPRATRTQRGRAPVYLKLHGGPSSHATAGWQPTTQYLLARGIAVLDFNYRGSTGGGKTLARLNDRRLRPNEVGDLLDAVAWIKRQPQLDGNRVAVGGPSYGGYLTNAVVGKHPGVFVAAVSEVGVADWPRNLRNASPQLKASDRVEYGDIDDPADAAFFATISPMNDAARVRTPMIVQTGANDPRNGADELDAYVLAIRRGGGTVRYMRYDNEGHGMVDMANIIHFNRAKAAFLEEHFARGR